MSRRDELVRDIKKADAEGHTIEFMADWMAKMEEQYRKNGEFKSDVQTLLNKVRSADNEIAEKVNAFIEQTNLAINEMLKGLNFAESRVNGMWNTTNTLIEFLAQHLAKIGLPDLELRGPVGNRQYTAEQFKHELLEIGAKLMSAAIVHRKTELARIRSEQRKGTEPAPMQPMPASFAQELVGMIQEKVHTAIKDEMSDDDRARRDEFSRLGREDEVADYAAVPRKEER